MAAILHISKVAEEADLQVKTCDVLPEYTFTTVDENDVEVEIEKDERVKVRQAAFPTF